MAKADWIKIRIEYETTGLAYRKLAAKHGVSFNTLQVVAKREGWVKSKNKTQDKIMAKTRQKVVVKTVNRNARHLAVQDLALDAIEEYLQNKHYKKHVVKIKEYIDGRVDSEHIEARELDVADTKALHNIVSALDKVQSGQRLAEGVLSEGEKQKLAIERKKLEEVEKDINKNTTVIFDIPRPDRTKKDGTGNE